LKGFTMSNSTTFNAVVTASDTLLDYCIENENGRSIGLQYDPSCFLQATQNPLFTLAGLLTDPATGDGIEHAETAAELAIPRHVMCAQVVSGVPLEDFERYMGRIALAWMQNHRAVLLMQYLENNPHLLAKTLGIAKGATKIEASTAAIQ
jgi:hypothetical protein